jgi:hypothetical protein
MEGITWPTDGPWGTAEGLGESETLRSFDMAYVKRCRAALCHRLLPKLLKNRFRDLLGRNCNVSQFSAQNVTSPP